MEGAALIYKKVELDAGHDNHVGEGVFGACDWLNLNLVPRLGQAEAYIVQAAIKHKRDHVEAVGGMYE